ncbi:OB fold-containing protein [Trypanosoma conorhini]|uniref:OB fold-containing protein n=1 Tax=Trypanosoma conorhini TaxID=83891 RepID=A0A422PX64_9TRYP|nr:OB fold-containing protein [Trypanosoma conorhini]RNF22345.1 OB fold-containing protein [Trypanosoma conorhini]
MELHIFDFDGTIFYSPSPSARIKETHGANVYARLMRPLTDNGLGWFQSLTTLLPPAVPTAPPIQEWYLTPVLRRMMELRQRQRDAAAIGAPEDVKMFVLTGRDEKFRYRIEELLTHGGLRDMLGAVLLKPHETYGTVKFKLEALYSLIAQNRPKHVFYYEDRVEQGQQLLDGIRLLSQAVHPDAPESLYVHTAVLKESGEVHPTLLERRDGKARSGPALRWWDETRRRVAPDPLTSILPFTFTMLLIDPSLSSRCERLLSASAEDEVVAQLRYERDAYESSNPGGPKKKSSFRRGSNRHYYPKK